MVTIKPDVAHFSEAVIVIFMRGAVKGSSAHVRILHNSVEVTKP